MHKNKTEGLIRYRQIKVYSFTKRKRLKPMNWENWEASLVELKEQAILENEEGCERLSRSKVSSLVPVVADLRSARVGRC